MSAHSQAVETYDKVHAEYKSVQAALNYAKARR